VPVAESKSVCICEDKRKNSDTARGRPVLCLKECFVCKSNRCYCTDPTCCICRKKVCICIDFVCPQCKKEICECLICVVCGSLPCLCNTPCQQPFERSWSAYTPGLSTSECSKRSLACNNSICVPQPGPGGLAGHRGSNSNSAGSSFVPTVSALQVLFECNSDGYVFVPTVSVSHVLLALPACIFHTGNVSVSSASVQRAHNSAILYSDGNGRPTIPHLADSQSVVSMVLAGAHASGGDPTSCVHPQEARKTISKTVEISKSASFSRL
jgi:hypothetical protein